MYRTIAQLDAAMDALVKTRPDLCTRVSLNPSVQGRPIHALRLRAGGGENRRGILIVGGMHARELMNPDAIIELAFDLAQAYTNETGLAYGGAEWSALDVRIMMETLDIWMLPCTNPDGRNCVMTTDWSWRKNRRDNPGTTVRWRRSEPQLRLPVARRRSADIVCDPCSPAFVGSLPFSEPEADNIRLLCDTRRIDVFIDVHSFSEFALSPGGMHQHKPRSHCQILQVYLSGFVDPSIHLGTRSICRPPISLSTRRS